MSKSSTYPLRLPKSLKDEVVRLAERDQTSINQFIAMAVAEKVSALETEVFFEKKAKGADFDAFRQLLNRADGLMPIPGDEIE